MSGGTIVRVVFGGVRSIADGSKHSGYWSMDLTPLPACRIPDQTGVLSTQMVIPESSSEHHRSSRHPSLLCWFYVGGIQGERLIA